MPIQLSRDALAELSTKAAVPAYDPKGLAAGILHFGVGNFHRAHQAVYLDALFNIGIDQDWGIVGAGVRAADEAVRRHLKSQDWLTTVVEQEADAANARVTAPMVDYLPPGDSAAIVNKLADPAIRIVSLTITEGGYYIDPASQRFDPKHPDMVHDAKNFTTPQTVFGLILAGLKRRRDVGIMPFTVMSCDNIPGNGEVTRNAVVGLAQQIYPELAAWVRSNVSFPSGMVDRITPATSDRERQVLASEFGIADNWPVFCERFKQWVVEDEFPAGRPALERVGVQFVHDVAPFELMKIRILNGGHATIAYPAALLDIHFVHEAMAEPLVSGLLDKVEREEIIPVVPPVPGTDLGVYYRQIVSRFGNPRIGDTVQRLCLDGSNRQPKFIVPSVADRLAQGGRVEGLALVSALWARYCYGETESGAMIAPNDPDWERLQLQARRARRRPAAWLEMGDIYGEVAGHAVFAAAFEAALEALWRDGTRAVLGRYVGG
ncbi:MAG TPA: mannitol dehydrogenase family protein [Devosiaceae bacterium]|jgi:mannitol 2-dehydrogenase|nr:mannitol dehydrogenase family protein [Devosiaceae bacterium]